MKISRTQTLARKGRFTLIEMIGVLAVIAILASLLIPKIYESINSARVNNAIVSYNTVKAAIADHYAKYGALDKSTNGIALNTARYDLALVTEGFLDKLYLTKVGSTSWVEVITAPGGANPAGFDLSGSGGHDIAGATPLCERGI